MLSADFLFKTLLSNDTLRIALPSESVNQRDSSSSSISVCNIGYYYSFANSNRGQPRLYQIEDVPGQSDNRPVTVLDICTAAERVAGQGTVVGAQLICGLWRVYPATKKA
eukprot:TRINITY_DN13331_c1_g2_i2.p1 TRINITY_DN13331_c1_g2~~TRINITY_DN13331_c1_g2_i2.p1  ORF type:complete len:110 (-),score=8.37 TRINITY_DN13331_c1_g2_i2:173-502(-)